MSVINYQPHIDGLRAIAVLSVLIFHVESTYLPGGFLGVDVFFVISGFLITSIIYRKKIAGTFSFADFYARRAKRILPPLFLVLSLVLLGGYFVSLPHDFYKLGVSSLSVISFIANIQFSLRTGDYFSNDSAEWPLLHTWSLSVEEQYYFIFPLLLSLIMRKAPAKLLAGLLVLIVMSTLLAEVMSRTNGLETYSYYLTFTRMGELLVGSLLAVSQAKKVIKENTSSILSLTALFGLFAMLFLVDETSVFPGFSALLLCSLTAVLINSKNTAVTTLLQSKPLVFIGLISYSLYLFHWPVLAFIRYLSDMTPQSHSLSYELQCIAVILMFGLSIASYYLVESPLRKIKMTDVKVGIFYFLLPTSIIASLSAAIVFNGGFPDRLSNEKVKAGYQFSHIDKEVCSSFIHLGCKGGEADSSSDIVVYGNSHGEHYFHYVSTLGQHFHYAVALYAKGGCPLISTAISCKSVKEKALKRVKETQPEIFVLAFRWDTGINKEGALLELTHIIEESKAFVKRVVVLAQPPLLMQNPSKVANCERLHLNCGLSLSFDETYPDYNEEVRDIVESAGAEFFDPYDYVSDKFLYKNGAKYYYFDNDHLSVYGNVWLANSYLSNRKKEIFK